MFVQAALLSLIALWNQVDWVRTGRSLTVLAEGSIHHKRAVHTSDDVYSHGLLQSALKAVIPLLPASAGGRGLGAWCADTNL